MKEVMCLTLKERRLEAGLRQSDLARILGVDQAAVSKWESGDTKPCRKHRKRLAKLYKCSEDDLLKEET